MTAWLRLRWPFTRWDDGERERKREDNTRSLLLFVCKVPFSRAISSTNLVLIENGYTFTHSFFLTYVYKKERKSRCRRIFAKEKEKGTENVCKSLVSVQLIVSSRSTDRAKCPQRPLRAPNWQLDLGFDNKTEQLDTVTSHFNLLSSQTISVLVVSVIFFSSFLVSFAGIIRAHTFFSMDDTSFRVALSYDVILS